MIVIGAVFLALAALGTAAAIVTGRDTQVHLDGWGFHLTTNLLWVYAAGAVAMLLLMLSLSAFRRAARRRRRQRQELKARRADDAAASAERAVANLPSVDLRTEPVEGAHAYRTADDPGPERRYTPGEERVT